MVAVPGYTQAIRTAETRLLLIIDSTLALFYEEQPVLKFIEFGLQKKNIVNLTHDDLYKVERALRGVRVYPNYSTESEPPQYSIHSFTKQPCTHVFIKANNESMSVVQYFLKEYQLTIQYPKLPCIMYFNTLGQQEYLPLEFAVFSPQQKVTRPFGCIDIKKYKPSALKPSERATQVASAIKMLYQPLPPALSVFNLNPDFEMLKIDAHTLPPPTLHFHPDSKVISLAPVTGRWNMEQHRVYQPVTLTHWAVLPFVVCEPNLISKFLHRWTSAMLDLGIQVKDRNPPILPAADPKLNIETALQHVYLKAGKETTHPDLLVFILPDRSYTLYTAIKRICDTILGVASQCITLPILKAARANHFENLCLKLNVKLPGGTNVSIEPEELSLKMSVPTIFMGADVTHPAQNADSPSIASVVASMNMHASKYISVSRIQPLRAEIILDMGSMVFELLQEFYKATGTKPQRILFYRDGISEGQFSEVIRSEVIAIRKACRALDPNYAPKLTFMVVQKRHHARFYPGPNAEVDPKYRTFIFLPPSLSLTPFF
ncbi:hypothetical protein HMI56_000160 [Coelomomyces lativittatus]|nr:hypothetical protein HMI56_000160 [Coelomomyces lativittatus]